MSSDVASQDTMLSDPRLDAIILGCATGEWCKVAMLMARTMDAALAQDVPATSQSIAAHIYALAEAQRLEVKGNMRRWRTSEIRKAGPAG